MLELVGRVHAELGLSPPVLPPNPHSPFDDQLAAVIEAGPAMFSFTFGIPAGDTLARMRKAGILTSGTATTVEEAKVLADAGVDNVVCQGEEAGAHRGTFLKSFEQSMVPVRELVAGTLKAVSVPVFASGGLMDGKDIAAMLKLGAAAAQLGTAFLPCPECGTSAAHKQAVLNARADTTVVTRAYSGRPARGLRNKFIDLARERDILPFGQQNDLTRPMRGEAGKKGVADYLSLWAGTGTTRARQMPAAELVKILVDEIALA
jgi:nitronate monooxygenase